MLSKKGFTLIEILLVVAAIGILAGIVIIAINPSKQLGDTRNAQRRSDVLTILNAVYQYALDNNGQIPSGIPTGNCNTANTDAQICKSDGYPCTSMINLNNSVASTTKYIVSIPYDPTGSSNLGTGYYMVSSTNNRLTVCAPHAEQGATISVSR